MARLGSQAAWWSIAALLAFIVASIGVYWAIAGLALDSQPLARAREAYGRRDFNKAAELARLQLKTAPDDVEALRMLARSSARLNHDEAANLMFARLGSEALKAEDLFLLGRGLMRAGRGQEALALSQKAVAQEPDHAEALEQLVAALLSQHRLIEAAALAERLARLPGFEFSGELSLASILAELGDSARASALLQQALSRPEAVKLEQATTAKYRKLLARTLLESGQPAKAREELDPVLKAGPDRQASWLLSRALLQEGKKKEAETALGAADSYRADHPLEWEPARFVGEAGCAKCHREIYQEKEAARHSSTLLKADGLAAFPFPEGDIPDPDHPEVAFRFHKDAGRVEFQARAAGRVHRAVLEYALGSADHYVSFVGSDEQGQPLIIRLSRYQSGGDSGWVRTSGHSAGGAGGDVALGKPLDPADGVYRCLYCHSTAPSAVLKNAGIEAGDRGIGCERCHGPGGNHLLAVQSLFDDPAIVVPAIVAGEARLELCAQCHGHHQESSVPRTDPYWIRFQATTLKWSRCFTASKSALDCVTCHSPHHNAERNAAFYEKKCLECHSGKRTICPVSAAKDCLPCHMPAYHSEPLHANFADHYIRVHPPEDLATKAP